MTTPEQQEAYAISSLVDALHKAKIFNYDEKQLGNMEYRASMWKLLETPKKEEGQRFGTDQGKTRFGLLSPWALDGVAKVSTFGAKKYAPWNWAKGLSYEQTIDSLERHLMAWRMGETTDPESGLPHLDHVMWNAMALSHFEKTGTGTDDRWKKP